VLQDQYLPVDYSKLALGGFSAGGNVSLAIAQMDGLRGRFGSLVTIYPVVDFSGTFKGTFKSTKDGKRDFLENTGRLFDWGYITQGQDRTDSLLSPIYAKREYLPRRILFIGAEDDVLGHEAEVMALRLAGDGLNPEVGGEDSWDREGTGGTRSWMYGMVSLICRRKARKRCIARSFARRYTKKWPTG
jgi:acetyl esterase/lipase